MTDTIFSRGPARRPAPVVRDPLLQWATGLATKDRSIYAGWLCEHNRDAQLDEAMAAAGFSTVTIKHGSGNLVTHWAVETANLFVVASGVQSIAEMQHTTERYGIAFGWRQLPGGRAQSQIRFRAFLHDLLVVNYAVPLVVTAKGTITGDLLDALNEQFRVLDAIDAFRAESGKPPRNPPFYACSLPIAAGHEVTRGSGGQTREIAPPLAMVPAVVSKDYVAAHWMKRAWVRFVEEMLDETVRWSITTSQVILGGGGDESAEL